MPDTLLSPSGEPINAIKGFLDMSARLINQYQPSRLVACLEGDWRPSWRVELFPGYKANRVDESGEEEEPDTLGPQIPILLDILEAFGIPMLGVDDYEADDIMASFSVKERGPTFVATGDRDLFQLVDDKRRVKIVYLAKGVSNHDLVDRNWINNRYEIPGDRYALFAMVRGDASDGLPGVRGIGEKGAAIIANHFLSIEEALVAAHAGDERLTPAIRRKLIEGSEYIAIAPKLVHCAFDVPIPSMSIEMPRRPNSMETIWKYKEEYGLGSSIDRMVSALKW
jgi:5'-3' exonuclease